MIDQTWKWVKGNALWLAEAWPVGLTLAVFVSVWIIGSWLPGDLADHLRYWGLAFELIGIGTVAWGVRDRWILFNRPHPFASFRHWLNRRPCWGGRTNTTALAGTASLGLTGTMATLSHGILPTAPLEDRVRVLEANVVTLRGELANAQRHVAEEARKQAEALASERQVRASALDAIHGRVETLAVGGLPLELLGLISLISGAILATVSKEIVSGLNVVVDLFVIRQ